MARYGVGVRDQKLRDFLLARDLRSAGHFQRICQELMAARRVDQALEWAQRGLAELEGRIDHGLPDLRRLAASLHAQMGRHGEAVKLALLLYMWMVGVWYGSWRLTGPQASMMVARAASALWKP
jgi:hypothetical protein